jgi:hypothetical protein
MDSVSLDSLYEQTMAKYDQIFPPSGSEKTDNRKTGYLSHGTMKQQCNHCGNDINTTLLIKHSIVPYDISEQLGLENIKAVDLCFKCHRAIHDWNARSISWVIHNRTNRLRAKPLIDVAEEYVSVYQDFFQNKLPHGFNTKQLIPQGSSA